MASSNSIRNGRTIARASFAEAASVKYFDLIPTIYDMIPTVCANGVSEGK